MKTIITILLISTLTQLTAQIPTDTDGNGYINISTLEDLRWISENKESWDKKFELDNNIDASETKHWNLGNHDESDLTPDSAMGFSPIGNIENKFSGVFDGRLYKISNLYINYKGAESFEWAENIGLFGYTEINSKIENLVLIDCFITGRVFVGGLVGTNRSLVTNCSVSGIINGYNSTGGVIGRNESNLMHCQFNGNVYGENNYTGGLVGISNGLIDMSFAVGNVEGKTNTGGFVGSNTGWIRNCYSTVSTAGTVTVGGFIGYHKGHYINSYSNSSVVGTSQVGGFVGLKHKDGEGRNGFWDKDKSGIDTSNIIGSSRTSYEMQDQGLYISHAWNFKTIWNWDFSINNRYPFLRFTDLLSSVTIDKYGDNKFLALSPNPAQDKLNIDIKNNHLISEIEIVDLSGKVVLEVNGIANNQLDISNLMKGTYFIKIKASDKIYFDSFVK
jgi:hypothetical protein